MVKTLREQILWAEEKGVAIGHFNISDSVGFKAVTNAAKELGVPVIIGVSEGEREFIGVEEVVAMVKALREQGRPVYLNADHTYTLEKVKEAVDAGFDAVIIDGAAHPYDENVKLTKACVDYVKMRHPEIIVEAELGFIGQSSKILENIPQGVSEETQTKPGDAKRFIEETGVELFAPSVGNIHGIVKGGEPRLNIERIRELRNTINIPMVLHGASGNSDADIRAAIEAGIRIVHINTEIRVAYKLGIEKGITTDEVAPYKFLAQGEKEMESVVKEKLKLFNKM